MGKSSHLSLELKPLVAELYENSNAILHFILKCSISTVTFIFYLYIITINIYVMKDKFRFSVYQNEYIAWKKFLT